MKTLETKIPPPLAMVLIGILMWLVAGRPLRFPGAVISGLAFIFAAVGAIVELTGALTFFRARTTVDPIHPRSASKLVVTGIYRYTRNPMYVGDFLFLIAWGVFMESPLALVLAPLFVLYMNRFQISAEERALAECFGEPYEEFRSRVPRWL